MAFTASAPIALPGRLAAPRLPAVVPGLALCLAVSGGALGLEVGERTLLGRAWVEALVLAILLGAAVRTVWAPSARWRTGVCFSAKTLLEVAVVLLGASLSASTVMAAGWPLLVGIAGVVAVSLAVSYGVGRTLGLPHRMATLVACGNSICGNSAIAAVAPVIGADGDEVASSIAFTAVLGVAAVLLMPLLGHALGMTSLQYGAFAGLTVYAVPQVLAAAAPMGALAVQTGTLVKLVRVLMLGPVCVAVSMLSGRGATGVRPPLSRLVPWFILGFLGLAAARSLGAIPAAALPPIGQAAGVLTIVSMAALGLGVDVRVVARAGARVTAAVLISLAALAAASLGLIGALHLA